MDRSYVTNEVNKIIDNKEWGYPLNMAFAGSWVIANLKGLNLKVINVSKQSSLSDFYVIASATNSVQAQSIADEIVRQLKPHDIKLLSVEGMGDAEWILLDFGDIIFHIFQEHSRSLYNLDEIWEEAPQEDIPDSFYFGASGKSEDDTETTRGFF